MIRSWRSISVAVALMATPNLFSQSTFATVTGIITDSSGAVLPNVAVEAIEASSGYRYTAQSNDSGAYTLPDLREGTYRIHANHPGLADWIAEGVELRPRDVRRIDITLAVAAVDTKVEVTGGEALIETESDRISDQKSREYFQEQPATVRRPWDFVNEVGQVRVSNFNLIRYAGSRSRQGQQALDGRVKERGDGSILTRGFD